MNDSPGSKPLTAELLRGMDRVPALRTIGAHTKEWLRGQIIEHLAYAHAEGVDPDAIRNWTWPAPVNS
ncbi:hypothetical protein ACVBGC_02660 [Burkholderia stagnalis]